MSTHGAYVAKIMVKPHPNADKLALGTVGGFQVVVSKDTPDNSIGLFFSSELVLSDEFADANGLRQKDGGYFSNDPGKARVRAQRFRGEKSDGYFCSLDSLAFTGGDISKLKVGDIIDEFNGVKICSKYISPATAKAMANRHHGPRKAMPNFPKHYDTEQLAYYVGQIPLGSIIWMTLKLHGTSGRTGYIINDSKKRSFWDKLFRRNKPQYELISGTRNTVLGQYEGGESSKNFRLQAEELFLDKLHENEIVYYEIVGYEGNNTPIMPSHNFSRFKDKSISGWGDNILYTYGMSAGKFDIYIYRITQITKDRYGMPLQIDLSWPQVKKRAYEMGFKTPPELITPFVYGGVYNHNHPNSDSTEQTKGYLEKDLVELADQYADGPDLICPAHPREGVVLHILTPEGKSYALKHKGFTFKVGEGIAKEVDDYVDSEEIA